MTPVVSVLCPTRNRPGNVARLIDSARATAAGEIEFVFYTDTDAPLPPDLVTRPGVKVICGPRITLSDMWNACYDEAAADILMQCGDDIVFATPGWDTMVAAEFGKYPDRIVFVHGNDLLHGPALGTHGFLHRRWVQTVGYFTPDGFVSDYGDTWINDLADRIGRRVYLGDLITEHLHPAAGKAEWDQTHTERLARHGAENPAALFEARAPEREADAARLRAAITAAVVA